MSLKHGMTSYYVVVDAYPNWDSPDFESTGSGAVGCWIRKDEELNKSQLIDLVSNHFPNIGWSIDSIILSEEVDKETYADKENGKEFFERSITDRFVFNLHKVEREFIEIGDYTVSNMGPKNGLKLFIRKLSGSQALAHSLYSTKDSQWANGVSPNGEEFFPVWFDEKMIEPWREYWPEYEIKSIEKARLSELFYSAQSSEMMLAPACFDKVLYTCHPKWLMREMFDPCEVK